MRIDRLDLVAFGRFAGEALSFDALETDFHLVYGPNEAGKTTALEAVRSLLYGIPERTTYAYRHANPELRVGAQVRLNGTTHTFARRKGRKNTLLDGAGNPLGDDFLSKMLAGMERDQFERMFALTNDDLVAGGMELQEGRGEAGQALLAAGLGGAHISALSRELRNEADGLFRPRAQILPLNGTLKRVLDLGAEVRRLQLSGDEWARQGRELEKARRKLSELTQQSEALTVEQRRLQRIGRTLPLLAEMGELARNLDGLGEVAKLPPDFDERRRASLLRAEQSERNLNSLEAKLSAARQELADLTVPDELLQHAAEVEQLQERLGSHQKAQEDRVKLEVSLRESEGRIAELLRQLPGEPDLPTALRSLPDVGTAAALDDLAGRRQALDRAVATANGELRTCREDIRRIENELEQLPPDKNTAGLQRAHRDIEQQGDLGAELRRRQSALLRDQKAAETRLAELGLWQGKLEDVLGLQVPLRTTVQKAMDDLRSAEDQRKRLCDRRTELAARESSVRQELQQLAQTGDVPLEADLTASRESRDDGWQLIKRRYLRDEDVDLSGYAPEGDPGAVYEAQVAHADGVADRLRREAQKVERRAQLEGDLKTVRDGLQQVDEQLRQHDSLQGQVADHWRRQWAAAGIEPLTPSEMLEWLSRLDALRASVERLAERQRERDETQKAMDQACELLASKLSALGVSCAGQPLADLRAKAEDLLAQVEKVREHRRQLARDLKKAQDLTKRRERELEEAESELIRWGEAWTLATSTMGMGPNPPVKQVQGVLGVLREVETEDRQQRDLRRRITGIERDADEFTADVRRLVAVLASDLGTLSCADATRELQSRLAKAREDRALRDRLLKQIAEYKADIADQEEARRQAQQDLNSLKALARCDESGLQEAWERHCKHTDLRTALERTQRNLANAGDGMTETELRTEAEGLDRDMVAARLETLADTLSAVELQREQQQKLVWDLQQTLHEMDGRAAAALAADERQSLIAQVRDEAERYITLRVASQLLSQAQEAYRMANEQPMLRHAGDYFRRITCGAFAGIRLQYGDSDQPFLVGVRADGGSSVEVNGMSDGTRDQLYLALRLAAIESASHLPEPLPLIVDDILIRFDDDRARATLEVLGEVSRRNQVIFFTHHRRLQELAEQALGDGGYQLHVLSA